MHIIEFVTSQLLQGHAGPGGVNAMNGVYGAFVDSIPMIVVSGQVRSDNISIESVPGLRQFGDQEADIVGMIKPITKFSVRLKKMMTSHQYFITHYR